MYNSEFTKCIWPLAKARIAPQRLTPEMADRIGACKMTIKRLLKRGIFYHGISTSQQPWYNIIVTPGQLWQSASNLMMALRPPWCTLWQGPWVLYTLWGKWHSPLGCTKHHGFVTPCNNCILYMCVMPNIFYKKANLSLLSIHPHFQLRLTDCLILEDLGVTSVRILPSQLPDVKEWFPVDVGYQPVQIIILEGFGTNEGWGNCQIRERKR